MSTPESQPHEPHLADLIAARDRARDAFRHMLQRLEAAAGTHEGVTRELEAESARVRAEWKDAEARVDAFLTRHPAGLRP